MHGLENTTGSSTITLSAERFTSDSHTVEVVQPGVEILNLSGSYSNLSADDTDVYVQVGITHPTYNNAQLWQVQNVRAGSAGFEVTLTNSNVNVARLRSDEPAATGGQIGQVVRKTIPAGTSDTHAITTGTTMASRSSRWATGRRRHGDRAGCADDDHHWRAAGDGDHAGPFRDGYCDPWCGIDG